MKSGLLCALPVLVISPCQPLREHPTQATLVPIYFGTQDTIRDLQPVAGTNYILCNKFHAYYFFGGLYLKDDGYVLRQKPAPSRVGYDPYKREKYVPLTAEKINELQQTGTLPNPLPGYTISKSDYLAGYSLWMFLLLVVVVGIMRIWMEQLAKRFWNWYTT